MVDTITRPDGSDDAPGSAPGPARPRHRRALVVLLVALALAVVVVVVVAAAVWFLAFRDTASTVTTEDAVEAFRADGSAERTVETPSLPAPGVYEATSEGSESVGIPGLDEAFGSTVPVTVSHGDEGCFTYRADLNSHHWRSWTFCPTTDARFALVGSQSSTKRNIPGLDFGSVFTYTCSTPLAFLWDGQEVGQQREGSCTATADTIEGVTTDAGTSEVAAFTSRDVGGSSVDVVELATSDTFGGAQTGTEQARFWLAADTGLPVAVEFDTTTQSETPVGTADYVDRGSFELTTLTPQA